MFSRQLLVGAVAMLCVGSFAVSAEPRKIFLAITACLASDALVPCSVESVAGDPQRQAPIPAGNAPAGNNFSERQERDDVESLIGQLRSPNRDPNPRGDSGPVSCPKEYDVEAQTKVETTRQTLTAMGTHAFPSLIEHLNDKEYSLSLSTSILRGFSVGEVCFMIIEGQIDLAGMRYKSRGGVDEKYHTHEGYFSQYSNGEWFTQTGMRRWWEQRKRWSLEDM